MPKRDMTRQKQVSRVLSRLDDPWGITWRVVNALRRFSVRRTARFMSGFVSGISVTRPIFIIGAPRSGTTMMFRLLRESSALGSLPGEGHDAWRMFHHPRYSGWQSDKIGSGAVRTGERRFINAYFHANATPGRLVEKTPENSLRIAYLLDLFPDAHFLVVKRHPCEVVNSLINCWRHEEGAFRSYYLPQDLQIQNYNERRRWCFLLIENWREYTRSSIPEIAFEQWAQCVKAVSEGRQLVSDTRWTEVHLETLLRAPQPTMERILTRLSIDDEEILQRQLAQLVAHPVNSQSEREDSKWRNRNRAEIAPLMPRMAALSKASGYCIDSTTGDAKYNDREA